MEFDDRDDDVDQSDSDMEQDAPESEDIGTVEGGEDLEDFAAEGSDDGPEADIDSGADDLEGFAAEGPDDGLEADIDSGANDLEGFGAEEQNKETDDSTEPGTDDLEGFEAILEAYEESLRDPTLTEEQLAQIEEMERNGEMDEEPGVFGTTSYIRLEGEELTEEPINVDMPYYNDGRYPVEALLEHAADQEFMINSKTVAEFLDNCEDRRENGRSPESADIQKEYREGLQDALVDDLMARDPSLTVDEARNQAVDMMRGGAALHSSDLIAGGAPADVYSFGPRSINSVMGGLWSRGRAHDLYETVKELSRDMSREEMEQTYMNVHLDLHPRD